MCAKAVHHGNESSPRVPRTIQGIADALSDDRRMEFYRIVLAAEAGPELEHVIATWWGHAMLDSDPDRERVIAAAESGVLSPVSMEEVVRRRIAGSSPAAQGGGWRTVPIPDGGGLVEYLINEAEHTVLLTRVAPF
jgi:hypothetical protein